MEEIVQIQEKLEHDEGLRFGVRSSEFGVRSSDPSSTARPRSAENTQVPIFGSALPIFFLFLTTDGLPGQADR